MVKLLGILIFSFAVTFLAAVPFIDLLYKLKFQRQREAQKDIFGKITSIVNRLHGWKVGTPNAGGVLVILVTILLSALFYWTTKFSLNWTAYILYFSLVSFGLLGLYDDIRKFYAFLRAVFGECGCAINLLFSGYWLWLSVGSCIQRWIFLRYMFRYWQRKSNWELGISFSLLV